MGTRSRQCGPKVPGGFAFPGARNPRICSIWRFGKNFPAIFPEIFLELSSRTPAKTPETATAFSSFLKLFVHHPLRNPFFDPKSFVVAVYGWWFSDKSVRHWGGHEVRHWKSGGVARHRCDIRKNPNKACDMCSTTSVTRRVPLHLQKNEGESDHCLESLENVENSEI